jgi:hypothetical protein
VYRRDIWTIRDSTWKASACDAVLLFTILHGERPIELLREAARILRPAGTVAVIHWRTDIDTPRGPSADIRPSLEQVAAWAVELASLRPGASAFDLPPWHYGLELTKEQRGRRSVPLLAHALWHSDRPLISDPYFIRTARKCAGTPLEDLGLVPDTRHYLTQRDVMERNQDLIAHAAVPITRSRCPLTEYR